MLILGPGDPRHLSNRRTLLYRVVLNGSWPRVPNETSEIWAFWSSFFPIKVFGQGLTMYHTMQNYWFNYMSLHWRCQFFKKVHPFCVSLMMSIRILDSRGTSHLTAGNLTWHFINSSACIIKSAKTPVLQRFTYFPMALKSFSRNLNSSTPYPFVGFRLWQEKSSCIRDQPILPRSVALLSSKWRYLSSSKCLWCYKQALFILLRKPPTWALLLVSK